ncbi:Synaptotagmin 2 [Phytophthora citrophthora]|uniref:Synaptotagmin 2 n=1 Tax=Phytophthora citrophthora TaxID=4793 RepID=A0AAD9LBC6_9STRA|nr:Synaptotagmin 2 [Phytophthora citrophthora]
MPYLHVTLFSAADLPASDSILVGGKSDPYVVIKVGNTKHRSLCLKNNLNPQWNPPEQFVFPIEEVVSAVLSVKVFDMDFIKRDDLLGELVLPVAPFADKIDLWQHEKHHLSVPKEFSKQRCQPSVELEVCLKHVAEDRYEQCHYVWENQSRHRAINGNWKPCHSNDRKTWSSYDDFNTSDTFAAVIPPPPPAMKGSGWRYCVGRGDGHGWMYAKSFSGPWSPDVSTFSGVRRRLWENVYKLDEDLGSPISDY